MTEVAGLKRFVVPEVVVSNFHLRPGDVVADFGAGQGFFAKTLSKQVGREGTVYACEIQKQLVEAIGEMARTQHLGNISPVWCDLEELNGTKIPEGTLDAAIVVNSFFQFEDKATTLEEIKRTLRQGGKLFIIDWAESFGGLGPHPDQVVSEATTRALAEEHGFVYERAFDAGDHHYGLAFRL